MFLNMLPEGLRPWVADAADVVKTVLIAIVVLKLLFGADMLVPLVVVTSSSMVHEPGDSSWRAWMTGRGISDDRVDSFPMQGGFNMGDMILVKNPEAGLGDVVIYERDFHHLHFESTDPIIHRVVGVAYVRGYVPVDSDGTLDCLTLDGLKPYAELVRDCHRGVEDCPYPDYPVGGDFRFFITKGDHNTGTDQCSSRLNISYPVNEEQVKGRALLRLPYLGWLKLLLNFIISIPVYVFRLLTLQF